MFLPVERGVILPGVSLLITSRQCFVLSEFSAKGVEELDSYVKSSQMISGALGHDGLSSFFVYFYSLLPERTTPDAMYDRTSSIVSLNNDCNLKTVAMRTDVYSSESQPLGEENTDSSRNRNDKNIVDVDVSARTTMLPKSIVTIFENCLCCFRVYDIKTVLIHVGMKNTNVITMWPEQGQSSKPGVPMSALGLLRFKPLSSKEWGSRSEEVQYVVSNLRSPCHSSFASINALLKVLQYNLEQQRDDLRNAINGRQPRTLLPSDQWCIRALGEALVLWIKNGGKFDRSIEVTELYNVFMTPAGEKKNRK
jgi:hypothetical protein